MACPALRALAKSEVLITRALPHKHAASFMEFLCSLLLALFFFSLASLLNIEAATIVSGTELMPEAGNVMVNMSLMLASEVKVDKDTLNVTGIPHFNNQDIIYMRTHALISGDGKHRLFQVSQSGILLLNKLILVYGATTEEGGGAILVSGINTQLVVKSAIFSNNMAAEFGAAIYAINTYSLTLTHVTFANNVGGGIYVSGLAESPTLMITRNVVYSGNEAKNASYKNVFCEKNCIYRTMFTDSCDTPMAFNPPDTSGDGPPLPNGID